MWKICVDTGGTFTDCLARSPDGELRRAKVLSSGALRGRVLRVAPDRLSVTVHQTWAAPADFVRGFLFQAPGMARALTITSFVPETGRILLSEALPEGDFTGGAFLVQSPDEAPVLAARLVTGTPAGDPLPPLQMRLASTRATNALLEGTGARTAFFVTAGFGDLLRIGSQQRPDLFAVEIRRPDPLHSVVVEVEERLDAVGQVLRPLDLEALERAAREVREEGIEVAAVALLHSYRNPAHEDAVRARLLACGFSFVSCSHELAPMIRLLPRAETAVVDARLGPVMNRYLERVESAVEGRLRIMTSAGGLVSRQLFRAKDSLLSGPAGGVVGAVAAGIRAEATRLIPFDMGGTSTDVSRFDGDFEYTFEQKVGEARLLAPSLKIETVAAGGGSICSFDGNRLRVGPESAAASPGPACYGGGGPLTLTDVHVLLGRIDPGRFGIPAFPEKSRERLDELKERISGAGRELPAEEELLNGFLQIANERMADSIRKISVREGYDPAEYTLVAFGGAGGLHACSVSRLLGVRSILWPAEAGLLSALGLQEAVVEKFAERQVLTPLRECENHLEEWLEDLAEEARAELRREEDLPPEEMVVRRRLVDLRLEGQESVVSIELVEGETREQFIARYREIFGYFPCGREIEVTALRAVVSTRPPPNQGEHFQAGRTVRQRGEGRHVGREELLPGEVWPGPVVIQDSFSTFAVEPGWEAVVGDEGTVKIAVSADGANPAPEEEKSEVVQLELYTNRLTGIAEEMGVQLQRTALSTNIRERLDFSCAILDEQGFLVVNAPHVPVHLGALGLCVREVLRRHTFRPGDMILTNHPGIGGSHLPDLTTISPVFVGGEPIAFVANRAHHAEVGGMRPGSMPPRARSLMEEGVVLSPTLLYDRGEARYEAVRLLLEGGAWPSRAVDENLADLQAQAAANLRGVAGLTDLAVAGGVDRLRQYLERLKESSAAAADRLLSRLPDGPFEGRQELDDGFPLQVRIEKVRGRLRVNFAGSGPVHPENFNATPAIVHSALIYVLRLLLGEPVPLNEGLMQRVDVRLPEGMLNPPFDDDPANCPAVVAGNVETSQRLVDTLLLAFGGVACSQGTMNNFVFGADASSYYETIGGGAGAGPGFAGASAVHTHMTNTSITDPEILEFRYPVRLERFAIRRGSGGKGKYRGGDGLLREITFLEAMDVSLLTQHRVTAPYGREGGEAGAAGRQRVIRAGRETQELPFSSEVEVEPGDRLIIETPGGGGWGSPVGEDDPR